MSADSSGSPFRCSPMSAWCSPFISTGSRSASAQAAAALRPIAGDWAFALFSLGIIGTGLLAVPVLAGSAAYAVGEAGGWRIGLERPPTEARRFYAVIGVAILLGIGVDLSPL